MALLLDPWGALVIAADTLLSGGSPTFSRSRRSGHTAPLAAGACELGRWLPGGSPTWCGPILGCSGYASCPTQWEREGASKFLSELRATSGGGGWCCLGAPCQARGATGLRSPTKGRLPGICWRRPPRVCQSSKRRLGLSRIMRRISIGVRPAAKNSSTIDTKPITGELSRLCPKSVLRIQCSPPTARI